MMKIEINNFGPIASQSIDLEKDLYLIFGKNNLGKSYGITVAYLALKHFLSFDSISYPMFIKYLSQDNQELDISDNKEDIKNQIDKFIKRIINLYFIRNFESSLIATYSSLNNLQNRYTINELSIKFTTPILDIVLGLKNNHLKIVDLIIKIDIIPRAIKIDKQCRIDEENNKLIFYFMENDSLSYTDLLRQAGMKILKRFYLDAVNDIESTHYLPASRSGLYQALSAFGQIIAELSKRRSFLKQKIELPGIPEHLSDYFIYMSEISNSNNNHKGRFENIATSIENNILKGKVTFDADSKIMNYTPDRTQLTLELSSTSSMVSELAPVVTYLRHIVSRPKRRSNKNNMEKSKPLIFIEEPESHLHPSVQIKIMKIFSELVKLGAKLVITTHSNYIFNTANNLIINRDINYETFCAQYVTDTPDGSVMEPVSTDTLGMEDKNFLPETESLFEEKIQLLDELNDVF